MGHDRRFRGPPSRKGPRWCAIGTRIVGEPRHEVRAKRDVQLMDLATIIGILVAIGWSYRGAGRRRTAFTRPVLAAHRLRAEPSGAEL
jgi:hypothetical protein